MLIGIITSAYFRYDDYEEGFKKMREHGYTCADYQDLANKNDPAFKLNEQEYAKYLIKIGKCAEQNGIKITQLHGLWPSDESDEEIVKQELEVFKKQIRGARYLNCEKVVCHTGAPFGWGEDKDPFKTYAFNIERFDILSKYAADFGVTVCVENLPFIGVPSVSTVKSVKKIVREIDRENLKVCLDVGHANVFNDDIGEDIRLLGGDLAALHIHDNRGRGDDHLLPYQGNVKWAEFLKALKDIDYKGDFTLETSIHVNTPEPAREEMRKGLFALAKSMAGSVGL